MTSIRKATFVCVDLETTGLEPEEHRIIEIAAVRFTFDREIDTFETLINPIVPIPAESTAIHNITDDMVKGKPTIDTVLPELLQFIGDDPIIGHGILFDISFLDSAAKRNKIPCTITSNPYFDTLRLARLYGDSPTNSLEALREHFNIPAVGAHRAMNDVRVNIEVFKHLTTPFKTLNEMSKRLKKPIIMRAMPLGKHKGRAFSEIPLEYLIWAAGKDFDQDLLYSLRSEIKRRKQGSGFQETSNPFHNL